MNDTDDTRVIGGGPKLRLSRVYVGMNPVQMSELLKVDRRQYSRWEIGSAPIPRTVLGAVERLVEKFDAMVDGFLDQRDVRLRVGDPDDMSTMAAAIAVMERPELEPYRPHPVNDRDAFLLLARAYMGMTSEKMMVALREDDPRVYRAWEHGDRPLPVEVREQVEVLLDRFEDLVDSFVDRVDPVVVARRDDYPVIRALSLAARGRPDLELVYVEGEKIREPLRDPVAVALMRQVQLVSTATNHAVLAIRGRKSGVDVGVFRAMVEAAQKAEAEAVQLLAQDKSSS